VCLAHIRQIDRVQENGHSAKADFAQGIELEVGFADAAIRIVRERLFAGVAELEANSAALLVLNNAGELRGA